MATILKLLAAFFSAGTIAFAILYAQTAGSIWLTLAITFGTFAYHFIMRLLIGLIFNTVMRNHADYTRRWYQVGKLETALYEKLRVQRWKGKMPTYHPALFDPRVHSWDEIAHAIPPNGQGEKQSCRRRRGYSSLWRDRRAIPAGSAAPPAWVYANAACAYLPIFDMMWYTKRSNEEG